MPMNNYDNHETIIIVMLKLILIKIINLITHVSPIKESVVRFNNKTVIVILPKTIFALNVNLIQRMNCLELGRDYSNQLD